MTCARCGRETASRPLRLQWPVVALLWVLGLALAWQLGGALLHDVAEGMQKSLLPVWKLWATVAALALAAIATALRLRRPVCPACREGVPAGFVETADGSTRRTLLRAGGAAVAASVGGAAAAVSRNAGWMAVGREIFNAQVEKDAPTPRAEWAGSRIRAARRLGRTNVMVSDISLGSGRIHDLAVPEAALERGVTYVDTAPDYADAGSETLLGQALQGRRDRVFIATKFCRPDGHLPNDTPVPEIIRAVEQSLARLRTDHVDLIHIHSCDRVDRLMAPNIHEAFDRLKEQGKARFLGVSTHTPNLEEVANTAIDSGRFDVMMLAYHFGMWPQFGHILEKARQHDVGVVAMKTLKGARHADLGPFRDDTAAYSQAAFRWVLSNPHVSCLVISMATLNQVDEYLAASGTVLRPDDVAVLERYDTLVRGDYCQPHCGLCLSSCPEKLPINDILRYRMYARDYGWEREGMRLYARLERTAALCAGCPAPCAGTCPQGIPIRTAMLDAHHRLTL